MWGEAAAAGRKRHGAPLNSSGGDLAPSLGGRKKFSRTKISERRFFRKNFHAQKFWWPFFSHRPGFSDFYSLFSDSPYIYCVKCRIWPFLHKKKHYFRKEFHDDTYFFTLFELSRPSHNTTSQNIGGTNAWAVPPPQFFLGGPSPQSPPRSPPLLNSIAIICKIFCSSSINGILLIETKLCHYFSQIFVGLLHCRSRLLQWKLIR